VRNLKSLDKDYLKIQAFDNTALLIVDLNRKQLLSGLTSKGAKIRPRYKNKKYAAKKNSMNSKPGRGTPDLKLTGEFHAEMRTDIGLNQDWQVYSLDEKARYLLPKYADIFGLIPSNMTKASLKATENYLKLWLIAAGLN